MRRASRTRSSISSSWICCRGAMASSSARAISVASAARSPAYRSVDRAPSATARCAGPVRHHARGSARVASCRWPRWPPRAQRAPWHLLESALRRCPLRSGLQFQFHASRRNGVERRWHVFGAQQEDRSTRRLLERLQQRRCAGRGPRRREFHVFDDDDLIARTQGTSPITRSASRNSSIRHDRPARSAK